MPTYALSRTQDAIGFEQPIRSVLPSLNSDPAVWSISPEASVFDAIERMAGNSLGALVVLSAQKLDGIISQDDSIREVVLRGRDARETRVSEIMTKGVYHVHPETTIEECMDLMASRRVRHLPVLEGSSVMNMLSIEDIVDWLIRNQRAIRKPEEQEFAELRTI